MTYLMNIIIPILTALSQVALPRWWGKREFRLLWVMFPADSMVTIHVDVEKLKVTYGEYKVTKLTKRRFLLRNTGSKAILSEKSPLQWQAPGPILDFGPSEADDDDESPITVAINAENDRKIDIQWKKEYLNPEAQGYIEVIYDDRKEPHPSGLSGSRKDTVISNKVVASAHEQREQRNVTRKLILAAPILGWVAGSIFTVSAAILQVDHVLYVPLVASFVTAFGTYVGINSAFAKARIEREEKEVTD